MASILNCPARTIPVALTVKDIAPASLDRLFQPLAQSEAVLPPSSVKLDEQMKRRKSTRNESASSMILAQSCVEAAKAWAAEAPLENIKYSSTGFTRNIEN